jgi:3-dehydroquinate synthase class II
MTGVPRDNPVRQALDSAANGVLPSQADLRVISETYGQEVAVAVIDAAADIVVLRQRGQNGDARKLAAEQTQAIAGELQTPEPARPGDDVPDDDPSALAAIVPKPGG